MVLGAISSDPQRGWIIIWLAPSHHCPGYSGELVRKCDSGNFGRPSRQQRCDPGPILGAVDLGIANDGECAGHEQAAQIAIPLFADTAEPIPTAARVLFGNQPDPGREVVLASATLATRAAPITLTLYAAIDQEDTNWIVVLKDVGPDVSVRTAREGERNIPSSLPRARTDARLAAFHLLIVEHVAEAEAG